jgi:hypothetical protein
MSPKSLPVLKSEQLTGEGLFQFIDDCISFYCYNNTIPDTIIIKATVYHGLIKRYFILSGIGSYLEKSECESMNIQGVNLNIIVTDNPYLPTISFYKKL